MVDYNVCKNKIYYSIKSIQLMKQQIFFNKFNKNSN